MRKHWNAIGPDFWEGGWRGEWYAFHCQDGRWRIGHMEMPASTFHNTYCSLESAKRKCRKVDRKLYCVEG
jgi:hypothetical protein